MARTNRTSRALPEPPEEAAAKWRAQRDELLDRINDEDLVPDWCWPRLTGVLAKMDEHPEYLAWLPVRFLQDVVNRGAEVFNRDRAFDQSRLFGGRDETLTLPCTCGLPATGVELMRAGRGRRYELATCPVGHDVVRWERQAEDSPV